MLLPGLHIRYHEIYIYKEVHLFGRGRAYIEVSVKKSAKSAHAQPMTRE